MQRYLGFTGFLMLSLSLIPLARGGETGWDGRLAGAFSGRLTEIQTALTTLDPKLKALPEIPIDDQGGTGGYASNYAKATPGREAPCAVEIRWPKSAVVDLVALVPARRYDANGLDAQYGIPDRFTVELIDADGTVLRCIAQERNVRAHPVRRGHPFVYQVSPPIPAAGLRISAGMLNPDAEGDTVFVHAWAEIFAFEGERNVARGSDVSSLGGAPPPAPWHWSTGFLVDGQTPLGLPEIPAGDHGNIGWLSQGRKNANESASITVDLVESVEIDAVRLIPAKKPTFDLPSGFGFPRKMALSVSETNDSTDPTKWSPIAELEMRNPGHNPVVIPFKSTRARYVKIEAIELWKAFESYPAFFALSEVEVLSGDRNVALGKIVRSQDGMPNIIAQGGRFWSAAALCDGFGPDGRLASLREWLNLLDQRLQLETLRHELRLESDQLVGQWRRAAQMGFAILGLVGGFLIIALPIRYRIKANRELLKVRERIAGDLHDEVGSNLGSIQMFADLAEGRSGGSDELKRIQRIAAETVSAVRDIVWLLRPEGEHRIGTVEHLRETSSIMLESLKWKFTANEDAWQVELSEEATRHLFLFFREALHNVIRHARAAEVSVRAEKTDGFFKLSIVDDGVGIDSERLDRPATLRALRQRSEALGANLEVETRPGKGTRLMLLIPLEKKRPRKSRDAENPRDLP